MSEVLGHLVAEGANINVNDKLKQALIEWLFQYRSR